MSEEARATKILQVIGAKLESKAVGKEHILSADFKVMFEGNEFYLFVYKSYPDVRLVGTPPSAIGKFGGDTDNWMWPRHTGDFSMFRVYTGPDGEPAESERGEHPLQAPVALPCEHGRCEERRLRHDHGLTPAAPTVSSAATA
jgi:hypothetical protein